MGYSPLFRAFRGDRICFQQIADDKKLKPRAPKNWNILTGGKWSLLISEVDILAYFQICDGYPYTDVKFNVVQNASSLRGEKLSGETKFDLLRRPTLVVAG